MITVRDHQTGDLFDPWEHLGEKQAASSTAPGPPSSVSTFPVTDDVVARYIEEQGRGHSDDFRVEGSRE